MHRQLGDGAVAPYCRHRHLRLERRVVLLPCPLHVLLPRYPRFLGAGLHLSHLSQFRGPAQIISAKIHSRAFEGMNEICSLEKNMAFLDIDPAVNPVGRLTQPDHDRAISMPARLENMELYPFVR